MQSAAWNITRIMGFLPVAGAKSDRDRREKVAREFIIGAMHSFPDAPKVVSTDQIPDPKTVIDAGFDIMDRNEQKTSAHISMVAGARLGIQSFLFLMQNRNIEAAHSSMIEMMKRQRDEYDGKGTKGTLNFTDLKQVLGLPTNTPTGSMPEELSAQAVGWVRRIVILSIIEDRYHDIFKGIRYVGPDSTEYHDSEIIKAMQTYAG